MSIDYSSITRNPRFFFLVLIVANHPVVILDHRFLCFFLLRFVFSLLPLRILPIAQDKHGGPIGAWCVHAVTSLVGLFKGKANFNDGVSHWQTDAVTAMDGAFDGARAFNQDIDGWRVGAVASMDQLFRGADRFNQNVGGWNLHARLNSTRELFAGAKRFNQNIAPWRVGAAADMRGMFKGTLSFNQNIGGWQTAAATDMNGMFDGASKFAADVSWWQTSAVTDFATMFQNARAFDQDVSGWANCASATKFGAFAAGSGLGKDHTPEFGPQSFAFPSSAALKEAVQAWSNDAKAAEASMFCGWRAGFRRHTAGSTRTLCCVRGASICTGCTPPITLRALHLAMAHVCQIVRGLRCLPQPPGC